MRATNYHSSTHEYKLLIWKTPKTMSLGDLEVALKAVNHMLLYWSHNDQLNNAYTQRRHEIEHEIVERTLLE
jgi:hypothetical protein